MVHVHIQDVFVKVLPMTFLFLTYFPIWKLLLEPWQHHEFVFAPKRFNTCSGPLGQHEWLRFIGGGTWRKPTTCHKLLTNFITYICIPKVVYRQPKNTKSISYFFSSLYWNNSEMILTYLPTYVYKLWSHPWMGSFHLNKI
jgi:hypothetical protein